ncbi:enediyne biosynthesis protein UnbU [Actinoplanes sp. NPDC051859]|uniref:enediyne biosynthesis protein UnbU n=1 Tax=Actinoplanes sp. NPDC051859 TaxID=3363909 RepID=UPI0037B2EA8A
MTLNPPPARSAKGLTALRRFAISITVFTILGHAFLGFEQAYLTPIVAMVVAYGLSLAFESLDAWAQDRPPRYRGGMVNVINFLLPAHIAALACAMLLYGNQRLMPTVFAVTLAIASKYLVRIRVDGVMKHFLNPSNFGISLTLVLFSWVAIAPPYQFTENVGSVIDWALPAGILMAGTMINAKLTNRMPLILGWVGGFALQAVLRWALGPDSLPSGLLVMTGVAFILFTNYMITDPQTTPSRPRDQVLFGGATAGVYGLLVVGHITFGLFYALTIVCAGRFLFTLVRELRRRRNEQPAIPQPPVVAAPAPETARVAG